jgi:hypothetical protein
VNDCGGHNRQKPPGKGERSGKSQPPALHRARGLEIAAKAAAAASSCFCGPHSATPDHRCALRAGAARVPDDVTPVVIKLVPELKPSMNTWLAAKNPQAPRFDAAFIMLTHPAMRPYVDPGVGRVTPPDRMGAFRDNWWRFPSWSENALTGGGRHASHVTYPLFLTRAQKKSADDQWRWLAAINAPDFLCAEAIGEARRKPKDERVPWALYQCIEGCTTDIQTSAPPHSPGGPTTCSIATIRTADGLWRIASGTAAAVAKLGTENHNEARTNCLSCAFDSIGRVRKATGLRFPADRFTAGSGAPLDWNGFPPKRRARH